MASVAASLEAKFADFLSTRPRIILGSESASRRQILHELLAPHGSCFTVRAAKINEKSIRDPEPAILVASLAKAKAEAIIAKMQAAHEDVTMGYLLTCDQVVVHEGRVLEKPESEAEAREFIAGYARSPPSTVGGVLCTDLASRQEFSAVDTTTITFRPLPEETVDQVLAEGECLSCAGALQVEHALVAPYVERLEGSLDSVMGLSKQQVMQLLLQAAGQL
ncbi:inosine triphosphate pyrophosphatase-like protein [Haematococcus lacustris]